MRTAEEMYNYCLENGFGQGMTKKWALKHFKLIEENLQKDEEVLMTFIGLHNYVSATKHQHNFAYALTNKRFIMAQKKLIGQTVKTVLLDMLNDINTDIGMAIGVIKIDTVKETFSVGVNKNHAKNIQEKIQELLLKTKEPRSSNINNIDEIRKYKKLLDDGIITEEEFNKKKKELLGL